MLFRLLPFAWFLGFYFLPEFPVMASEVSGVLKESLENVRGIVGDPTLLTEAGRDIEVISLRGRGIRQGSLPNPGLVRPVRFLIQGGLHGNEGLTSELVLWLAERFRKGHGLLSRLSHPALEIDFIPWANPDGKVLGQRSNARGINLNRNFGVLWGLSRENPGPQIFSEVETRAIRALFRRRSYAAAVDIHGYVKWVVAPSGPGAVGRQRGLENEDHAAITIHDQWTRRLREEMAVLEGYELKTSAELGDGGAFEDWAFWDQKSLAFCLEMESPHGFEEAVHVLPPRSMSTTRSQPYGRYEAFIYRMFRHALDLTASPRWPRDGEIP